jgi:antitoxin VapB
MALHIKDPEAAKLAHELAELKGEQVEQAVLNALRDQLARQQEIARKLERVREIQRRVAALPVLDPRTPDEIIGYNEFGVPE